MSSFYSPSMPYNVAVASDMRNQQLISFGMAGNSTASTPIITCPSKGECHIVFVQLISKS